MQGEIEANKELNICTGEVQYNWFDCLLTQKADHIANKRRGLLYWIVNLGLSKVPFKSPT